MSFLLLIAVFACSDFREVLILPAQIQVNFLGDRGRFVKPALHKQLQSCQQSILEN